MEAKIRRGELGSPDSRKSNIALNNYFDELIGRLTYQEDLPRDEDGNPFEVLSEKREMIKQSALMGQDLENLLEGAKITAHFRHQIVITFIRAWQMALDPRVPWDPFDEEVVKEDFFFLDRGKPESGGVFDPARARGLETIAISKGLAKLSQEEESYPNSQDTQGKKRLLEEWQSQFRELIKGEGNH